MITGNNSNLVAAIELRSDVIEPVAPGTEAVEINTWLTNNPTKKVYQFIFTQWFDPTGGGGVKGTLIILYYRNL